MENTGGPAYYNTRTVDRWNDLDFLRWPGLRLISAENGVSRVELLVEDHHRGGGGSPTSVNGGIVSYMFDALLGSAVASTWDEAVVGQATVNLNVSFLDTLEAEERITGEGRVVRGGGSLAYCEGRVWDDSGRTGATCTGIYRVFRRR